MSPRDGELILRLRQGEVAALGALYDRYRHVVYRTALAVTADRYAAEDILQETFLRLQKHVERVDPDRPIEPWLYRVSVNLSYTYLRRRRWQSLGIDEWLDRVIGPPRSAEHRLERHETWEAVSSALTKLPVQQRIVVVLYYLDGLSLREIADVLECPVGTVKSRLHYGRENLRRALEGHEETTLDWAYDHA
jgi:RNA polymerase sigma-70 factor (ECF subfamily)